MKRRTLLQALLFPACAATQAAAGPDAVPRAEHWREVARKRIHPNAGTVELRPARGVGPVHAVKVLARGSGVWIYGVETAGADGATAGYPMNRRLAADQPSGMLRSGRPVTLVRVSFVALPFRDKAISLALLAQRPG